MDPTANWSPPHLQDAAASADLGLVDVVIVDALDLVRRAMRMALDDREGIRVAGDAGSIDGAARCVGRNQPHVVVIGTSGMGCPVSDAVRAMVAAAPQCQVVVLLSEVRGQDLYRAIQAGARGVLTPGTSIEGLAEAIRRVSAGRVVADQDALSGLFDHLRNGDLTSHAAAGLCQLTAQERRVLALLTQGASKDDIAAALNISTETVRTHAHNLLRKLGVHSRLEAVAFVNRHDLLPELLMELTPRAHG